MKNWSMLPSLPDGMGKPLSVATRAGIACKKHEMCVLQGKQTDRHGNLETRSLLYHMRKTQHMEVRGKEEETEGQ